MGTTTDEVMDNHAYHHKHDIPHTHHSGRISNFPENAHGSSSLTDWPIHFVNDGDLLAATKPEGE